MVKPKRLKTMTDSILLGHLRHVMETWIGQGKDPVQLINYWSDSRISPNVLNELKRMYL